MAQPFRGRPHWRVDLFGAVLARRRHFELEEEESGGIPANAYVAEDGTTPYVAEDGVTFYVTET
jgi:hypothetical protein